MRPPWTAWLAVTPKIGRMRFEDAAEDLLNDCRVYELERSLRSLMRAGS